MIEDTQAWFHATDQISTVPSKRWLAFYTGMQLEELSEKIELIHGLQDLARHMKSASKELRKAQWDGEVFAAFRTSPDLFLDSDADLIWVTIGAAIASGANLRRGYEAVMLSNWDKADEDGKFTLDETGKVVKPADWKPANLMPFTHLSVRP